MRRPLSIALLALFILPMISPLFALSSDPDAGLPACCRRNGKHHCMMTMAEAQASLHGTELSATPGKCPYYPAAATQARHHDLSLHAAALVFAAVISHPAIHLQTEARARVARDCARQKRGPPALFA
jgi:hypothetical protein